MSHQRGFTLIELIIVIVILGILAVTALPRFVNLSDDAHLATTKAEAAAFKSAIDLVRSTYLIRDTNPVVVAGATVAIDTTSEWPTGTGSGSQLCINLWESLLQNAEPVVAMSNVNSLAAGWNAFGTADLCAYGKKFGDRTFANGDLPHFVYYIHDVSAFAIGSQTYAGSAGEVQKVNF
ncbi:prepilin-type N-terminal cleavage/methylation domain-containing protein [Aliiglaciecola lipolytica]|uniref:MSHA pilin protein MshA n=1 Tax=Aliiglaciecola lipolytica E3 TaxID=1127673 RepID=K6YXM9_9ALTE|nr:prepilin-type N-terminal cleavage/methylation domain-containing protein [Aliiglaciecola lipolytica]GAC15990.1 hypothetical protein GLIP_3376 [Aliiglaciecola lipolytica E3]